VVKTTRYLGLFLSNRPAKSMSAMNLSTALMTEGSNKRVV